MESFKLYNQKKERLLQEIKDAKGGIGLKKKNSNLFRDRKEGKKKKLDVRHFNKVLEINTQDLTANVEGMITYDELVKETLKYNLLPTVTPQLKTITIGGAISGLGIESSSFRHGLVHETVIEMEILLSDGRVVLCTPKNKNRDLFFAVPNSYGTLGYILRLKVKLIRTKKYVELTHLRYNNSKSLFEALERLCKDNLKQRGTQYDFIDGVAFSENEEYITLGKFVDSVHYTSSYNYMSIYYQSIRQKKSDYLKTSDYIWRWDTDWFWKSNNFGMQNPVLRLLFGKFMLNSAAYWKIISLAKKFGIDQSKSKEPVVQDVGIPIKSCADFMKFFNREIKISPIWLCPFKSPSNVKFTLVDISPLKLYVDFGFWDSILTNKEEGHYNRVIERKVAALKGFKSLYSTSYYTPSEFWSTHNRLIYLKLKKKYDPSSLLKDLYSKVVKGQ